MLPDIDQRKLDLSVQVSAARLTPEVIAVRTELHDMLAELAEALRGDARPVDLLNAVHHARALIELAELRDGLLAQLLRGLNSDLRNARPLDGANYAFQLERAAAPLKG